MHKPARQCRFFPEREMKIDPQGARYAIIETCVFYNEKQFIHLTGGHSAGPISQLWTQRVVIESDDDQGERDGGGGRINCSP